MTGGRGKGNEILRSAQNDRGSGSSRIAAYNMGFAFTGCEINPEVYRLQEERFARHIAQENLFIERTAEDAEQNGEDGAHD